jgi:hypothetical protein
MTNCNSKANIDSQLRFLRGRVQTLRSPRDGVILFMYPRVFFCSLHISWNAIIRCYLLNRTAF